MARSTRPICLTSGSTCRCVSKMTPQHDHAHAHSHGIVSFAVMFDKKLHWPAFEQAMAVLTALRGSDLLRVKGIVAVEGATGPVVVHAVQHTAHRPIRNSSLGRMMITAHVLSSSREGSAGSPKSKRCSPRSRVSPANKLPLPGESESRDPSIRRSRKLNGGPRLFAGEREGRRISTARLSHHFRLMRSRCARIGQRRP